MTDAPSPRRRGERSRVKTWKLTSAPNFVVPPPPPLPRPGRLMLGKRARSYRRESSNVKKREAKPWTPLTSAELYREIVPRTHDEASRLTPPPRRASAVLTPPQDAASQALMYYYRQCSAVAHREAIIARIDRERPSTSPPLTRAPPLPSTPSLKPKKRRTNPKLPTAKTIDMSAVGTEAPFKAPIKDPAKATSKAPKLRGMTLLSCSCSGCRAIAAWAKSSIFAVERTEGKASGLILKVRVHVHAHSPRATVSALALCAATAHTSSFSLA